MTIASSMYFMSNLEGLISAHKYNCMQERSLSVIEWTLLKMMHDGLLKKEDIGSTTAERVTVFLTEAINADEDQLVEAAVTS